MIKEIYIIKYQNINYYEDNAGESFGEISNGIKIEFNYNDAINSYVSFCEDGYKCSYELLDERFTKIISKFDSMLCISHMNMITALKDNETFFIEKLKQEIEMIEYSLFTVFDSLKIEIFDIQDRSNKYKELALKKSQRDKINN